VFFFVTGNPVREKCLVANNTFCGNKSEKHQYQPFDKALWCIPYDCKYISISQFRNEGDNNVIFFTYVWNLVSNSEAGDVRKNGTEEAILTQGERGKNGSGEDCKINSFMICTPQQIWFGWPNQKNEIEEHVG
jgi:hypothetical protein